MHISGNSADRMKDSAKSGTKVNAKRTSYSGSSTMEHTEKIFYCFTVHFNSLNVTHQLMHFQYNNILV